MPDPAIGPPFECPGSERFTLKQRCQVCGQRFARRTAPRHPAPATEPLTDCQLCGEPLLLRDDEVMHRECSLRNVMGGIGHLIAHDHWCVQRNDPDAGLTYHQSALLVDAFVAVVGVDEAARRA